MQLPTWNDPLIRAGTMIRTALWLVSEIGEGNVFTKDQHRAAFPEVVQADRRMRDLRRYGWVIHTSLEDVSLDSSEQRLVTIGSQVWKPEARKGLNVRSLTAKERMNVFSSTDYQCSTCGIAGGESYPDLPHVKAVLAVSRRTILTDDGKTETAYVPECKLCRTGEIERFENIPMLIGQIHELGAADKAAILALIETEPDSPLANAWKHFRRFSKRSQGEVKNRLVKI